MPYAVRRPAQLETQRLRDLQVQLYRWPGSDPHLTRPTLLLHGWGDTGETWQFLVDHLPRERAFIAPDLRGFGRTQHAVDGYWFPDYLADLEALLDHLSADAPMDIVGHSMGANITMLYAGVRPHRVRRLVALEGFGMPRTSPDEAPARYAQWLDEMKRGTEFATYDSLDQFAQVLARRNPRTPAERLDFVARSWSRRRQDGRIELRADPRHKRVNPVLYQRDQAEACWRAISAALLFVIGTQSELAERAAAETSRERLEQMFRSIEIASIEGAGHMLHHEQPAALAAVVARFLYSQ